jgi:hypothetical protein
VFPVVALRQAGHLSKIYNFGLILNRLCIFFLNYLILPTALDTGVYSAPSRNEYQKQKQMFLGSRERPVREADNRTAICEPIA